MPRVFFLEKSWVFKGVCGGVDFYFICTKATDSKAPHLSASTAESNQIMMQFMKDLEQKLVEKLQRWVKKKTL